MLNDVIRKAWVLMLVYTPVAALAGAGGGVSGGLNKATRVMTEVQVWLVGLAVILVTISLIGCAIAMAFYKKRWDDVAMPVIGGLLVGMAPGIASFLIN